MTHLLLMLLADLLALAICAAVLYDAMHPADIGLKSLVDPPTLPTVNDWRRVFGLEPLADEMIR